MHGNHKKELNILKTLKKYIKLIPSDTKENTLCLTIGYSLGGYNWYNGDSERRGYYLYCSPCNRETKKLNDGKEYTTVTETLGKGAKVLLKEVTRQSKKSETEAVEIAYQKECMLINLVVEKYGLKLAEVQEAAKYE